MKQISVTLTDEQYAYIKGFGRLYLREVVEALRTTGSFAVAEPTYVILPPEKKRRWRLW